MEQGVRTFPAVSVAYFRHVGPYGKEIAPLWETLHTWAETRRLWKPGAIMYGISHDSPMDTPPEKCRYDACIEVPGDFKPDGGAKRADLPGGVYATLVFFGKAEEVGDSFAKMLRELVPGMGREFDFRRPLFERYEGPSEMDEQGRFACDICIPVK